jgi:hypothetical protein
MSWARAGADIAASARAANERDNIARMGGRSFV